MISKVRVMDVNGGVRDERCSTPCGGMLVRDKWKTWKVRVKSGVGGVGEVGSSTGWGRLRVLSISRIPWSPDQVTQVTWKRRKMATIFCWSFSATNLTNFSARLCFGSCFVQTQPDRASNNTFKHPSSLHPFRGTNNFHNFTKKIVVRKA